MKKGLLKVILMGALPVMAYAECSNLLCADVKIQNMQVDASGAIWVQTTGTETALSCTPDSGIFLKLDANTAGGKNVYSALLAYKVADKPLKLRIVPSSNPCEITYVVTD